MDFQIDLAAGETEELYLEYGQDVEPVEPKQPVAVEQVDSRHCITTRVGTIFSAGGPGPFLYMVDQRETWYDSWTAAPEPQVTIEQQGPMRTSICVSDWHTSGDGCRFCLHYLRLHFFAGRSDIRLEHMFVFDQDPDLVELAEIGVSFPLDPWRRVTCGLRWAGQSSLGPARISQ